MIADDAFTLAGRPWRRRTYLLRFDTLPAVAHFGYVEHGGRLVQVYALTAWGAGEATRAATATGSTPTGMEARCSRPVDLTRNTSRRLSGVLAAKRNLPSGERASGRTCPLSNTVNLD